MNLALALAVAYLIGSIPNGLIVGKLMRGVDIRQFGSKNIGATNAYRVLGPWPAFWVFLTDAMKGVAGVHIMAIEWEEKVGEIAKKAGLLPRPKV